jgi:hypothetical protein
MRGVDTLRTLAIGLALILAIGTTACASDDEESDEKGESATVDATMSTEDSEGTADETSPVAEEEEEGDEISEEEAE